MPIATHPTGNPSNRIPGRYAPGCPLHDPDKAAGPELPTSLAKALNQAWEPLQEELAHLSSNGSRIIAKGSGHFIRIDRPDLVIEAVRKVVDQCREQQVCLRQQ